MRAFLIFCFLTLPLVLLESGCTTNQSSSLQNEVQTSPPIAKQLPHELTAHGETRVDPYFWMRERENPEVITYLEAENAYTKQVLAPHSALKDKLFQEMKGRIKPDDSTVPQQRGKYLYYTRYEDKKEHPIYCRKGVSAGAKEEILLDANELAKGHSYFKVTGLAVSPDSKLLAYAVDTVGRRISTIYFKDLKTGQLLKDKLPEVTSSMVWANDNTHLFFVKQNPTTLRFEKVYRYRLRGGEPVLVYHEKDETFSAYLQPSLARKHIFILAHSTLTTEQLYLDADKPTTQFKVFQPRRRGHEYFVVDGGDRFYISTNDKAKNFRLMETPYGKTRQKNWKEVLPHRRDTLITGLTLFRKHIVLDERHNGLTQIRVMDRKTNQSKVLPFKDEAYVVGTGEHLEFDTDWLRLDYESMTTPESVIEYSFATGKQELRKEKEVLGGFQSKDYKSQRFFARGKDGAQIPISLVHRKDVTPGPRTPLLVYAYGSYGYSMEPYFSSNNISLLDRGFIYAIAHVRGGSEMGRAWYEEGRQKKKMNSFEDFIASTEQLHSKGYSSPNHTFAMGGSAGGLLMGAVLNMRPDLYQGVIADVPFVDVVTTMLDTSIPLTTGEFDEWGNPAKKADYLYMKSYSPYDNVSAKDYTNLLVTTGLEDSQVQYWEPAKWVAKLRKMKTDDKLLLLHTNMEAGHGGKSGRFASLEETALKFAFLLMLNEKETKTAARE